MRNPNKEVGQILNLLFLFFILFFPFSLRFFASPSGFLLIREEIQRSLTARGPWALHTFRKNSAIEHFIFILFFE